MGFRFRRSARLGPLRFNFAKGELGWWLRCCRAETLNVARPG